MKVIASRSTIFILACSALIFASCAHTDAPIIGNKPEVPRTVSFKGTAADIIEGSLNLTGRLTKPEGKGPFPAVVLLHGCGGMQPRRDDRWSDRLSRWGYVTLQVCSAKKT
jgi:poly(3-hydroxybutyrate) depolymerase